MKAVTDFFALRPVFTLWSLRVVWIAFLVQQSVGAMNILSNRGYFSWDGLFPLLTYLLHILVNVGLVRLLIEVAAAVLLRSPPVNVAIAGKGEPISR